MTRKEHNSRAADSIDENLKRVFQEALSEEVPDRFKDLLAQLKAQDSSSASGDNNPS